VFRVPTGRRGRKVEHDEGAVDFQQNKTGPDPSIYGGCARQSSIRKASDTGMATKEIGLSFRKANELWMGSAVVVASFRPGACYYSE
jgi:hypothetical protein